MNKGVPEGKSRVSTSCDETDEQFFVTIQRTLPDALSQNQSHISNNHFL